MSRTGGWGVSRELISKHPNTQTSKHPTMASTCDSICGALLPKGDSAWLLSILSSLVLSSSTLSLTAVNVLAESTRICQHRINNIYHDSS